MEGDLLIVVMPMNTVKAPFFAAAGVCKKDFKTDRPVAGVYLLNFARLKDRVSDRFYYFSVFAHELAHILGFQKSSFKDYLNENGEKYKEGEFIREITLFN